MYDVDECDEQHRGGQCDVDYAVYVIRQPTLVGAFRPGYDVPQYERQGLVDQYGLEQESSRPYFQALLSARLSV